MISYLRSDEKMKPMHIRLMLDVAKVLIRYAKRERISLNVVINKACEEFAQKIKAIERHDIR